MALNTTSKVRLPPPNPCQLLIPCPGVAYQLTPLDPLIDGTQCALDAAMMADLGANTIRVYHVDPTADHDACMTAFANAGIYLFLDLDTFDTQFDQVSQTFDTIQYFSDMVSVQALPFWNQTQLSAFEAVLDEFQQYDNLAGVFVANEAMTMRQYRFAGESAQLICCCSERLRHRTFHEGCHTRYQGVSSIEELPSDSRRILWRYVQILCHAIVMPLMLSLITLTGESKG